MEIFQKIANKYKEIKQKSLNKKDYIDSLKAAITDGKLSSEEIKNLDNKRDEYGLSALDVQNIRLDLYQLAFTEAKSDDVLTKEEEKELKKIQGYLGIDDEEIVSSKKELSRMRLLNEIQNGNIPEISVTNLVIPRTEKIYWSEPSALTEEKVINRRYVGGSQGVNLHVAKGLNFRVGSSRGHLESEMGMVSVSEGDFIITSKRIIFKGDRKSFAIKLDNILDLHIFSDGIRLTENNKAKQRIIKFSEVGNHDIVGAILTYSINHFG